MQLVGVRTAKSLFPPFVKIFVEKGQRCPLKFLPAAVALFYENLKTQGTPVKPPKSYQFNFISRQSMYKLTREYHKSHGKTADVLTFTPSKTNAYANIYLCPEIIALLHKSTILDSKSTGLKLDLLRLVVHSMCHLSGHDHVKWADYAKMWKCEQHALKSLHILKLGF